MCELDVLTDAWNLARRRALDRLAEEALQVGADVVVGVRLQRSDHDLGKGLDPMHRHGHRDPRSRSHHEFRAAADGRLGPGLLAAAQRRA